MREMVFVDMMSLKIVQVIELGVACRMARVRPVRQNSESDN